MNRRKALMGILGITGIGFVSINATQYILGNIGQKRGELKDCKDLITELVDIIIPSNSTPGAKAAKVQDYIVNYMENCSSIKEYNNFLNGLNDLQQSSERIYNRAFTICSKQQKNQLLENLDNQWNSNGLLLKISNKIRGRSFFNILKTLTVEGYCSSKIGATEFLVYKPLPGIYISITNLKSNQRAWATK